MANAINTINYQDATKLPVQELVKVGSKNNEVVVTTPHKGKVIIPVLEGWLFKTEKDGSKVIEELQNLEREAKDYLLDQWLEISNK